MAQIGDELFNGAIVVIEVDGNGKVEKIKLTSPLLGEGPGAPLIISFEPAQTLADIQALFAYLFP